MTLKEAARKAEEFRPGCHASNAGDCGDRWAISFEEDRGHLGGFVVLVNKSDGSCEGIGSANFAYALIDGEIKCYSTINEV